MGIYINPGNEGFATARRSTYVDKSGLIAVVNKTIGQKGKLSLISRPRRFGKSFAAQMLCAYYCRDCDSSALFADLEIANGTEAERAEYLKHLNQYNVLYLDITDIIGKAGLDGMLPFIERTLSEEICRLFPDVTPAEKLADLLVHVAEMENGKKWIALIDEWDAPVRDSDSTPAIQKRYLEYLRSFFKSGSVTDKAFAASYMTGILPMRKDGSQSAISEFNEYTIMRPGPFAPYVGFLEEEVRMLCEENDMDFEQMKSWYDGYTVGDIPSVYNPNSVMKAIQAKRYASYWQMSSAADNLLYYVNMDYEGLAGDVNHLIADKPVPVDVEDFRNDPKDLRSRDDVITLLIHFGYLCYDADSGLVRIPNEEIREEFLRTTRKMHHPDTMRRVKESDQLIRDTINKEADKVAAQIEKVHREEWEPRFYNNEQSLRGVIKLAYFCYRDNYKMMEELASGKGYADIVFLPKKDRGLPALVIELKWKKDVRTAIDQIRDKDYPSALKDFADEILLVGISYDKEDPDKTHRCVIEALNTPEEE
ncbi:MAG: AAA family ATPase [Lachnospiraceae bacterium]|nr:AAA family ATPase [Lachnospiraceae bacterium]